MTTVECENLIVMSNEPFDEVVTLSVDADGKTVERKESILRRWFHVDEVLRMNEN